MANVQQIICPHCLVANRVPAARLQDRPGCGKCKKPLFDGTPVDVSEAGFQKLSASNDLPAIVDSWAPWCGPCKRMPPHLSAAASQLEPHFRRAKVSPEGAPSLSTQLGIRSIP